MSSSLVDQLRKQLEFDGDFAFEQKQQTLHPAAQDLVHRVIRAENDRLKPTIEKLLAVVEAVEKLKKWAPEVYCLYGLKCSIDALRGERG